MPIFATTVFHGGPHTLGLLMARVRLRRARRRILARVAPVGRRTGPRHRHRLRVVWRRHHRVFVGAGAALAILCLSVAGFGFIVQMAASNTIIQTIVDDDKRGRVMSFYMMAFLGTAPFGSLLAGWMSSRIGAPHTVLVGGVCCLAGAAWFAVKLPSIRMAVRPIYMKLGILPQVAAGLSDAAEVSVPPERQ